MTKNHSKVRVALCIGAICSATPTPSIGSEKNEIVTFVDTAPATLNPRFTLDATGQRINMLLFRALTRVDAHLKTSPDLAASWKPLDGGKKWRFELAKNLLDHAGMPITASDVRDCLQQYFQGTPASPLKGSFPNWKEIRAEKDAVVFELTAVDPFLPRNVSLLRFFRVAGEPVPCREPKRGEKIIGSGDYRMEPFDLNPEQKIVMSPIDSARPKLIFEIVRDETSRLLKLLKGDADALQNSFSPTKTDWLLKNHGDRFRLLERDGVNVSYLAFNLRDPILSNLKVRRAIAAAIDREKITRNKLKGFAKLAGSFLSPELPESAQSEFKFDPVESERLLDEAGYPKKSDGKRLKLKYKTTPNKDGFETAQILQEMLGRVGIEIELEMVESAVFFASIRKGNFQLYSSRWIGISDGSIYQRTLKSDHADNRVKYANTDMDRWIMETQNEMDDQKRIRTLALIQAKMGEDLPYFPLWFWTNALILKKGVVGLEAKELSLSGSYVPLSKLKK